MFEKISHTLTNNDECEFGEIYGILRMKWNTKSWILGKLYFWDTEQINICAEKIQEAIPRKFNYLKHSFCVSVKMHLTQFFEFLQN